MIQAIRDYLQNLEDLCVAKQVIRDLESGKTRTVPLESVLKKYRLVA
ncbi:MAG: CopG family transcriptional regulator [Gammaproteobacteria bacterium]|nr:CopG family transcriptional regulator [Gammaproteobacteria bacterium]